MQNKTTTALSSASAFAFALLLTHTAFAQRTPLACQVEAAGGLKWDSGRWIAVRFQENKFILVQDGPSLTSDSAAKALQASSASCTEIGRAHV